MSVENALEYLRILDTDPMFKQKIVDAASDKAKQMHIITERGLEFSKDDLKQALCLCLKQNNNEDEIAGKRRLDDSELDSVNAAGILGDLLIAFSGAAPLAGIIESTKSLVGTIGDIVDGKPIVDAIKDGATEAWLNSNQKVEDLKTYIPF